MKSTRNDIGGPQDLFYSPAPHPRLTITKGEGIYLWDDEGRKYIDASSGPVTCNIGHGNPRVIDAMCQQAKELSFSFPSTARNQPNIQLADQLTKLAGEGFERALFVSGGSEAVDMAIKFCRQYRYATAEKKRTKLISCQPSYHGMTLGALAVLGDPYFEDVFGDMITMSAKIPAMFAHHRPSDVSEDTYALQCARALEDQIIAMGADTVLAFIIEPVGGSSSGAIAPPEAYFNEIRRICDQYGVFLIYDEVMSGIGRTGAYLTSHLWPHARPDISVVGKGLGAGYMPLAAVLAPASLVDHLADLTGFNYAHTYNASPLACAVGCAVLDEITTNKLVANSQTMGSHIRDELEALQQSSRTIGNIRGRGLLIGVELVMDKESLKRFPENMDPASLIKALGQERGILLYGRRSNKGAHGDTILIAPPLNITKDEVDTLMDRLAKTFEAFENDLIAKALL